MKSFLFKLKITIKKYNLIFFNFKNMATGNFYRGTSQTQDARFSNKDKKLLNSREWPPEFDMKVNMKKVKVFFVL